MLEQYVVLVSALLTLAVAIALASILRLVFFHIHLGMYRMWYRQHSFSFDTEEDCSLNLEIAILGVTTADYVTRSALKVNRGHYPESCRLETADSMEKTYEYVSGDENDDNIWRRPWSPSTDTVSSKRLHSSHFTRRLRKTWTSIARHVVQPWFTSNRGEYQLVNLSRSSTSLYPPMHVSRDIEDTISRQIEEPDTDFGTRTIRPPMPLYDGSEAPDYAEDMGLNLHILNDLDIPDYLPSRTTISRDKARRLLGLDV